MKNSALQFTRQYVKDAQSNGYINGNVAEHLILNVQSEDQGYQSYLTDDEIENYESSSSEKRAETRNEIEAWITDNFNFDVSEFEY